MMIIRPIQSGDLDTLTAFSEVAGVGVTTLPKDPQLLAQHIFTSERSFRRSIPKDRAHYMFALEDTQQGRVVGMSEIQAAIGLEDVWYNYKVSKSVHASKEVDAHSTNETLYLNNDLSGVSEVCSLYLDSAYRHSNNGRLLAKSPFLFLKQFADYFHEKIIAEIQGVSNDDGESPFWESLGKKFFQMEFSDAYHQIAIGNKSFIAELMPKYPIYLFMLSQEARLSIGKTHAVTRPAIEVLKKEGFHYNGYIDIFDAGPVLEAFVENIRAVQDACSRRCEIIQQATPAVTHKSAMLVANRSMEQFRALLVAKEQVQTETIALSEEQASALYAEAGTDLWMIPLRY